MNDAISKRIGKLQQFSINQLSITQLINIKEQIERRISSIEDELSGIERSVGMLEAGFYDKEYTLDTFTGELKSPTGSETSNISAESDWSVIMDDSN